MAICQRIYDYSSYKEYLKERILQDSKVERGYKSKLSEAMHAPSSFLSQILHGPTQITSEHAFGLAKFWGLNEDEEEYFLALVQLERTARPDFRLSLEKKLAKLKKRNDNLTQRLREEYIPPSDFQWRYYTIWYYAAIHLLTAIPDCRHPRSLSRRLQIGLPQVNEALQDLEKHHLIEQKGGAYFPSKQRLHLDKSEGVNAMNHLIWRQKVAETLLLHRNSDDLHYSGVHTLSASDFMKIRELILQFIQDTRKRIHDSPEEKLVGLTLDFFEIGPKDPS